MKKFKSSHKIQQCGCLLVIRNWNKNQKKVNNEGHTYLKIDNYLEIGMQANWDEKYLTQVACFSHVIAGWEVSHSSETSQLNDW